jgi:hypothetical protein
MAAMGAGGSALTSSRARCDGRRTERRRKMTLLRVLATAIRPDRGK